MPKITLDMSGAKGLVERHQGDINDTSASPHLRYLGESGQIADGIFMPFKKHGYMSPAVNAFTDLTGTLAARINSIQYDNESDTVFLSEEGINVLQLDGLDDTSLANFNTITSGSTISDMVIYEVNKQKALFYSIDSGSATSGMYVGMKMIDDADGVSAFTKDTTILTANATIGRAIVDSGSENFALSNYGKMAQSFDVDDSITNVLTGIALPLAQQGEISSGITIKVTLQAQSTPSTGAFTDRGAWATPVAYSINDTVTNGGVTYQCEVAHSSLAADEPGVGGSWEDYWGLFGAPDGTALATATVDPQTLPSITTFTDDFKGITMLGFSSPVTLTASETYWIVVEEDGTNMAAGDYVSWLSTVNDNSIYTTDTEDYGAQNAKGFETADSNWQYINPNIVEETYGFSLIVNEVEDWSKTYVNNLFTEVTGQDSFLHVADNALMYWALGNKLHAFDGSLTGGENGVAFKNVLQFPSYLDIVDITETRSRMYIGVQSSDKTTAVSQDKYFTSRISGVYVWDRRSLVVGRSDFFKTQGAKEIKSMFTSSSGNALALTVGNSGQTELRGIIGNEFGVIQTLEIDAYPANRRGVSVINDMSVWLGANGIFYAYGMVTPGSKERLYKIGDMSAESGAGLVTGAILVGNENASNPMTSILYSWNDGSTQKVQKWYPYGEGTLNSVAQTALNGNIYFKVDYLAPLTSIRTATVYCAPVDTADGTTIATIKYYKNQSSTPFTTKTVTNTEAAKGYLHHHLDEHNVNALQIEIEHAATTITGTGEFEPSIAVIDYTATKTSSPDNG